MIEDKKQKEDKIEQSKKEVREIKGDSEKSGKGTFNSTLLWEKEFMFENYNYSADQEKKQNKDQEKKTIAKKT